MDGVKLSGVPPPQDSEHNKNLPISMILLAYIVHYITTSFIFPFVTCSRYASGQVLIHIVCRAVRSRGNWAVELQTKLPEDYYEGPTTALLLAESAYYIELPHLRDFKDTMRVSGVDPL